MNQTATAEADRLRVLREYPLTAVNSARLDGIARLAAQLCGAPIALVSIVEEGHQSFIGRWGLEPEDVPREQSLCASCMTGDTSLEVPDARTDARFATNPFVTGEPGIRFYGGHPLVSPEGAPLGAICIVDVEPRSGLTAAERGALATLADLVISILEALRADARSRATASVSLSTTAELQQRFEVLADSLPQMVWSTPPDGLPDYFNGPWCDFVGLPAEASYGAAWIGFVHPDDADNAGRVWSEAVASGEPYEVRYRLKRYDGQYRWVIARGLPIRDASGSVTRWIGTCTDIEDDMAGADALELLSQELSHRIKNIFAVIGGLVSLSARSHPDAADFAGELYNRILALGRAHGFVGSRGAAMESANTAGLKGMLTEILAPYQTSCGTRFVISGDEIAIDDRSATPLALIFHELATNAAKYGAFGRDDGKVRIELKAGDPVEMRWIESGIDAAGERRAAGFGSRLIDMSISRHLGGRYETRWSNAQMEMDIQIPVANIARD